jgi:hypothetical protein
MRLHSKPDWESPTKLAQKLVMGVNFIHINDNNEYQIASKPDLIFNSSL